MAMSSKTSCRDRTIHLRRPLQHSCNEKEPFRAKATSILTINIFLLQPTKMSQEKKLVYFLLAQKSIVWWLLTYFFWALHVTPHKRKLVHVFFLNPVLQVLGSRSLPRPAFSSHRQTCKSIRLTKSLDSFNTILKEIKNALNKLFLIPPPLNKMMGWLIIWRKRPL